MKALRDWWKALEQLLLPATPPCGLCGEYPRLPVGACRACLDSLAIRWERWDVQGYPCFSLFPYQGFGRDIIHRMKFQGGLEIASTLGFFLGLAAREEPQLARLISSFLFLCIQRGCSREVQPNGDFVPVHADSLEAACLRFCFAHPQDRDPERTVVCQAKT